MCITIDAMETHEMISMGVPPAPPCFGVVPGTQPMVAEDELCDFIRGHDVCIEISINTMG